jgi:hypothetical protein
MYTIFRLHAWIRQGTLPSPLRSQDRGDPVDDEGRDRAKPWTHVLIDAGSMGENHGVQAIPLAVRGSKWLSNGIVGSSTSTVFDLCVPARPDDCRLKSILGGKNGFTSGRRHANLPSKCGGLH